MSSNLHFVRPDGRPAPEVMEDAIVLATSLGLGWDGVVAEHGMSPAFAADQVAFTGHFVGINLDAKPLDVEVKQKHGFQHLVMPPNALAIHAAGMELSHRNPSFSRWGAIVLSTDKVRRVLGRDIEPRPGYDVVDPQLAGVVRAMLLELEVAGGAGRPLVVDGLATAMAACLARHSGVDDRAIAPRGGLGETRLRRVKEAVHDWLADDITVERLAAVVGLSPAHFARAFKQQTGEAPHQYVMRTRVERARDLLALGGSIAGVASRCGFADSAHLVRSFKHRFGITPGRFSRTLGRREG